MSVASKTQKYLGNRNEKANHLSKLHYLGELRKWGDILSISRATSFFPIRQACFSGKNGKVEVEKGLTVDGNFQDIL